MLDSGDMRQSNSISDKTVLLYNETEIFKFFILLGALGLQNMFGICKIF